MGDFQKLPDTEQESQSICEALSAPVDAVLREEILALGDLTGLKFDNGEFRSANFERAILLDAIVRARKPEKVLEIGTGRGFGAFSIARAARRQGIMTRVVTLDVIGPDEKQRWPIRRNGIGSVEMLSRKEVWRHPDLASDISSIEERTGPTSRLLPHAFENSERFDFIFIDAGHDLHSVVHDLAWSVCLLTTGGCILMDDFAPMEDFGVGTCVVVSHARRLFEKVEIIPTAGVVFEEKKSFGRRGMVFLDRAKFDRPRISSAKLLVYRILSKILDLAHSPALFPVSK